MAIKGKRRTRHRTSRTVAGAPRPFLVPPKTPLFRRTATKVVLVVLAEAVVFLVLGLAGAQTEADRRRDRVTEFTTLVEARLYQGGAAQQSFPGPVVLPELGQAAAELQAGRVQNPRAMAENAKRWAEVAGQAGEDVGSIETEGLGMTEARNLLRQGLLLYSQLARQVGVAAELEGRPQRELADTIAGQMNLAASIFDTGWGKLQEERRLAGLPTQPGIPADLGGVPGGIPGLPAPGEAPPGASP